LEYEPPQGIKPKNMDQKIFNYFSRELGVLLTTTQYYDIKQLIAEDTKLEIRNDLRELLVAYDNFRLMTTRKCSCSEECIDAFLVTVRG
jgi:hypothetical protein